MDSHPKSALKSIIWRVMGVMVLATITYLFTRSWITTSLITVIHHATFLVVFYLHERIYMKVKETKRKSLVKAVTYEIILGMGLGGLIVLMVTGSWSKVSEITLTYTAVKLIMYFAYERIWLKIK
jgi:uncharacterized membrane protein